LTDAVVAALVGLATSAEDPYVRVQAVGALASGGVLTDPVVAAAIELARTADDWPTRQAAANALRHSEPTPQVRTALLSIFIDKDSGVRRAAGDTLVDLVRRHPDVASAIRADLAAACDDPSFDVLDVYERRPGWDYAYDALRTMVDVASSAG
jgi:HEAT repeat protein